MSQTKTKSLLEQIVNIGSGFFVALLVWMYVIMPVWNIDTSMHDNLGITLIFTVVSIVRGYLWRRFFNWWDHHRIT